jgi:hypothetical protein
MARTLKQIIEDWERENMVTVGTIAHAKTGRPVKPVTAVQIARALGCKDVEVKALADALAAPQAKSKRTA